MDGDVESAVAAGESGIGERVGQPLDQRRARWADCPRAGRWPGRSRWRSPAREHAGPIAVNLALVPNGTSASPFGFVDTPLDNSTGVTGAVPFTGWTLDDVEVTRVTVCRAAFGGEVAPVDPNCGGAAQIFVGFAVFIDGARTGRGGGAFRRIPVNTRRLGLHGADQHAAEPGERHVSCSTCMRRIGTGTRRCSGRGR